MNRRKFITSCVSGAIITAAAIGGFKYYFGNAKKNEEQSKNHTDYYLPYLGIMLAEHCNLNCKYCCSFSCIAEKEFIDFNQFEKDLARLVTVSSGRISGLVLLGGEPLLYPQIIDIIKLIRNYSEDCHLEICTNGILLNSMTDEFWECLHKYSVTLKHSLYPIYKESDIDKYYAKVDKYKVLTRYSKKELKEHVKDTFERLNINLDGTENYQERFDECPHKVSCAQMYKGNLYHCMTVPGIKHFNKKFNKNIPVTEADYLNIYKISSIEEIEKFFLNSIPFCAYCGRQTDVRKWENSIVHDITEWTYAFD